MSKDLLRYFFCAMCSVLTSFTLYTCFAIASGVQPPELSAVSDSRPTYYTKNGVPVFLTRDELATLDYVLRYQEALEQQFDSRITDKFIKKLKAACRAADSCELIDRVLGDFKGKRLEEMFVTLGLRTDI
jgi:hypothetical protein